MRWDGTFSNLPFYTWNGTFYKYKYFSGHKFWFPTKNLVLLTEIIRRSDTFPSPQTLLYSLNKRHHPPPLLRQTPKQTSQQIKNKTSQQKHAYTEYMWTDISPTLKGKQLKVRLLSPRVVGTAKLTGMTAMVFGRCSLDYRAPTSDKRFLAGPTRC